MLKTVEILLLILLFSSCVSHRRFTREGGTPHSPEAFKPGRVYQEGMASYYAHEFNGRKTASGETYDMHGLTAAHKELPFNTRVRVENMDNGMSVTVRINDRGPFARGRIIDLSLGAAERIGLTGSGTARVRLVIVD